MRFRNARSSEDDEPEINLIPLIDVLLMTLIFLIVTTSFSREARLSVKLPEASVSATKDDRPVLRVSIDAKGQYFINDQQLLNTQADTLRTAMGRAASQMKDPLVVIQADAKTPHDAVVRVMDGARRLGLTNITFATQQPGDAAAP